MPSSSRFVAAVLFLFAFPLVFSSAFMPFSACCEERSEKPGDSLRVAILPPEIISSLISTGGIIEYREDWSRKSEEQSAIALQKVLAKRGYTTSPVPESEVGYDLKLTMARMRQVCLGICSSPTTFLRLADYSVGQIRAICEKLNVNALFLAFGWDETFSQEWRNLTESQASIFSFRSVVGGMLTGSFNRYESPNECAGMSIIMVDSSGAVIRCATYFNDENLDLREQVDINYVFESIL
jgi:hypothetical protein